MTVEYAQKMRKAGYWLIVSNDLMKVIAIDRDKKKMMDLYKPNSRKVKIFGPLKTLKISVKEQLEFYRLHKLIWKNKGEENDKS